MAKAIVSTVKPNARDTPSKPIPTFGNAAARTALPHPPNTSQNVPTNSVAERLNKDIASFPIEITLSLCIQQMDYGTSSTLAEYSRIFTEFQ